jgi:predicted acyl esterase
MPAILTLTQYDIDGGRHGDEAGFYAQRGYAFVQVYVRGRGKSGGAKTDNLGTQVGRDGYDLVECGIYRQAKCQAMRKPINKGICAMVSHGVS